MAEKKTNLFNFGKGWLVIVLCMIMFYMICAIATDGTNLTAPNVATILGVDQGAVITRNGYAGLAAIIYFIVMSQLAPKLGGVKIGALNMIIASIGFYFMQNPTSLNMYTICYFFAAGGAFSGAYVAGGALVSKWFPKTKGVVMGYTTMGLNIASATWVLVMSKAAAAFTLEKAVIVPVIIFVAVAILALIFVKDTPQEAGINPDNVSDEVYHKEYVDAPQEGDRWTTKQLLGMREVWTVGIATGMMQLCSTGVMSNLVNRNIELGMAPEKAIFMMTVIALVGIFGSWFIGVLDDKFGTKRVMMCFCIWYGLAIFANVTGTTWGMYLAVVMIGMSIGGSANFMSSFPTSVFGRQGYEKMNTVVFPIQQVLTMTAFLIVGMILSATGSIKGGYMVIGTLAILAIIPVALTRDHYYNLDWKKEHGEN